MAYVQDENEHEGTVLPGNFSKTPVPRPNWRVEPQANLSRGEAANYRRMYHGPRMADLAADGFEYFSYRAAARVARDPHLAGPLTYMEKRLVKAMVYRLERYMYGSDY
jgi:hypothetical protein